MSWLHKTWIAVFALGVATGCNAVLGNNTGHLAPPDGGTGATAGSGGVDGGGAAGVGGSDAGNCSGNNKQCAGHCVDTQSDNNNCGACGTVCSGGSACNAGKCTCQNNGTLCGSGQSAKCVDTATDANNCGSCGHACTGGMTCQASACACPTGKTDCGGTCVDTKSDPSHCGSCTNACASNEVCSSGSCALNCSGGKTNCGGACVDTNSDASHCGSCTNACSAKGAICNSGTCACPTGQEACSGTCTDTSKDNNNCGKCGVQCTGGTSCVSGSCQCPTGKKNCSGTCTNVFGTDSKNCGACGNACTGGQFCISGTCSCGPSAVLCNGQCSDLTTDPANCGACGRACSKNNVSTLTCSAKVCTSSCTAGYANCSQPAAPNPDNGCETNINTNANNCGACGRPCSSIHVSTLSCSGKLCTSTCTAGYANCKRPAAPSLDDGCETNVASDPDNCGACGRVCSSVNVATRSCSGGVCKPTCKAGYADCNQSTANDGCETNTLSDPNNCGACGKSCGPNAFCQNATCVSCTSAGDPCCPGSLCGPGTLCTAGRCQNCGSPGEACCLSAPDCTNSGCASLAGANRCYVAANDVAGGGCNTGTCPSGTICLPDPIGTNKYCIVCGSYGEPCCTGGSCGASFTCQSGICG